MVFALFVGYCSDDEDFSRGINAFISEARQRRLRRRMNSGPFDVTHVGPENRIIAACTFDKQIM